MKFSERWLREWIDPPVDTAGLVAQLTGAGLEVDDSEPAAEVVDKVVVGRVLEAAPHPDADSLTLCRVDVGDAEPAQIVCGAPNARAGLVAPVALPGAKLPGGLKIRRSKIRGQVSAGMLCSAPELGMGEDADGLLELHLDAAPGTPLADALGLDDHVIDIDLTPNRGDCLYVEGIARDVAAVNGRRVAHLEVPAVAATIDDRFAVTLPAPDACPRYVGRVFRGVNAAAPTPTWMVEKLRRAGIRTLGPVVDVTNYVMMELGHPMHAFDLDRLEGAINVRHAGAGERVALLDGSEQTLGPEDLVIADESRAVALAGIMGGDHSAVRDDTTSVFLECAWFEPRGIAATARRLGMHTDASHRFERTVNPHGQMRAVERATALLLEIVGGEAGPLEDTAEIAHLPVAQPIALRSSRIRRLLGIEVPGDEVASILGNLHMAVTEEGDGFSVTPPPFRPDISMEADLIEEVARVRGLDSIPDAAPLVGLQMRPGPEARTSLRAIRRSLVSRGYQEAITYSFVDEALQRRMEPSAEPVPLSNPISSDMAVMRTSLMPGLLGAAMHNVNRQHPRVRLFESGLVFRDEPGAGEVEQTAMLGGIAVGDAEPRQWGSVRRPVDFFDVKGDLVALLEGRAGELGFEAGEHPALHPGQCARILDRDRPVGIIGVLHPGIARSLKLSAPAVLFEVVLERVLARSVPAFQDFSRQPAVLRDLSVSVEESVSAEAVLNCVGQAGGDMLQNLELFDVYRGEGVDSGQKSLTLSLTFQEPSRTLDEAEVEASMSAILDSLAKHLGATLRG